MSFVHHEASYQGKGHYYRGTICDLVGILNAAGAVLDAEWVSCINVCALKASPRRGPKHSGPEQSLSPAPCKLIMRLLSRFPGCLTLPHTPADTCSVNPPTTLIGTFLQMCDGKSEPSIICCVHYPSPGNKSPPNLAEEITVTFRQDLSPESRCGSTSSSVSGYPIGF